MKSTLWVKVGNLNDYTKEYNEVKMSILGTTNKPTLGSLPRHTFIDKLQFYDLSKLDSLIFSEACKISFEKNTELINTSDFIERLKQYDIPEEELFDTLEILDKKYYIETLKVLGDKTPAFSITNSGLKSFATEYYSEYTEYERKISFKIVNEKIQESKELSEQLNIPHLLVTVILEDLSNNGLIEIQRVGGGMILIIDISVELKRQLRNI